MLDWAGGVPTGQCNEVTCLGGAAAAQARIQPASSRHQLLFFTTHSAVRSAVQLITICELSLGTGSG